jgi:single-strand DNA-binding protein
MINKNSFEVIGQVCKKPVLYTNNKGFYWIHLDVATNFSYTNKQTGEKVESVDFHHIKVKNNQAIACAQYLEVGQMVLVSGHLKTDVYEKNGQKVYDYHPEAVEVVFGHKSQKAKEAAAPQAQLPNQPVAVDPASLPPQQLVAAAPLVAVPALNTAAAVQTAVAQVAVPATGGGKSAVVSPEQAKAAIASFCVKGV